jgi:DnaJ family protein C protein 25
MFKRRSRSSLGVIFALLLLALSTHGAESAEDADADNSTYDFPEKKWGSYYDPSNVFCGKYDCYKILGFDHEQWGRSPPDKNDLTQSYRMLSKRWHPDKNKDRNANDRFMKINKAYKVLTTKRLRKEYDYLRGRSDEYFFKYGSVTYAYKPKTDTLFVIFALLLAGSIFTWYAQKNRWQQIANRVVKDAVDGLKAGEGGSTESIELRNQAEEILKKKQEDSGVDFSDLFAPVKSSKGGKVKKTKKETKAFENEMVRPIIEELVLEIQDFGAGFHQPTWRDVLVVRMVQWPVVIVKEVMWQVKYYSRRLAKAELNDVEKEVLTSRAVGPLAWESASKEDREEMIGSELWNMENLEEWWELQEVKKLSAKEQKLYGKMKKQQSKKGNKVD